MIELGRGMYEIAVHVVEETYRHYGYGSKNEYDRDKVVKLLKEKFESDYIITKRRKDIDYE